MTIETTDKLTWETPEIIDLEIKSNTTKNVYTTEEGLTGPAIS